MEDTQKRKSSYLLKICNHHQGQQPFDELFAITTPVEWECVGCSRSLLLRILTAQANHESTAILCLDLTIVDVR